LEDWTIRVYGERSGEMLEQIRQLIFISTEPEARSAEWMICTKMAANVSGALFRPPWQPDLMDDACFLVLLKM